MRKLLKFIGISTFIFFMLGIGSCFLMSDKLPQGESGPEAEELTDKMFKSINKEAWDTTKIVQWQFMGGHKYLWDRQRDYLQVNWKNIEVKMDLPKYDGLVSKDGILIEGSEKKKHIDKAYSYFCNDSFWLFAPAKARDEGTTRKIVRMENGTDALLVSYSSGGVTPGDSYLWILDESGLPIKWKMWVKVLPIKGLGTRWSDWVSLSTGAKVATTRGGGLFKMNNFKLSSAQSYQDLGIKDPFKDLYSEYN